MLSTSGCSGSLNKITTLSPHNGQITCLQISRKNNSFLSTGFINQYVVGINQIIKNERIPNYDDNILIAQIV
ncbi:unnamed protein product [Paramecium pentaurelia]|uniref:Uncharacterized protein n=1 Tax=Paramecium pentaurelia TaxID=43138 RepID=A0A8S1YPU1_9CILI|nr:unnamed protein product [Paramecium pentaurelia]